MGERTFEGEVGEASVAWLGKDASAKGGGKRKKKKKNKKQLATSKQRNRLWNISDPSRKRVNEETDTTLKKKQLNQEEIQKEAK